MSHSRKRFSLQPTILIALIASVVFTLLPWTVGAQESTPSNIQLADGERLREDQTLKLGVNRNLVGGPEDYWYVHASLQVYEPLIKYDDHFNLLPGLATEWNLSPDGLVWEFKLRDDVTFSNGEPFTAETVLFNVERSKAKSGQPSQFLGGIFFDEIYGDPVVEALDDYTVTFTYAEPRPLLPYAISNHYSVQWWQGQFDENYNFTDLPIGSGPFTLVDWERDQFATIARNENYWSEKPVLENVEVRIYPNENSRLSALKAGEVDALAELGAVLPAQAGELEGDDDYVVESFPTACNTYLLFNGTAEPFNDVRIRQALSLAIDRDAFVNDLLYGYGIPAKGVILEANEQWFNDNPDEQVRWNIEEATQLLNEATGGERVEVNLLFHPPGQNLHGWPYPLMATYLQAILQPVGFDVNLVQQELAVVTESLAAGEYDFTIYNSCWATGEPNYQVRRMLGSDSTLQLTNHGGYNNPEVDALLDEAQVELDPVRQAELYKQAQAIGLAEVAVAPLYDQETVIAYRPFVRGLDQRLAYAPTLELVYLVESD
ncbi:MAG TPA: ABC transporter substrate-binding protein [Thermomicrobiales bacterium]|nr:ABC transporter substrate-binding protein [Thermomicrobiales bacterium]